jgi:hypothetical protein
MCKMRVNCVDDASSPGLKNKDPLRNDADDAAANQPVQVTFVNGSPSDNETIQIAVICLGLVYG